MSVVHGVTTDHQVSAPSCARSPRVLPELPLKHKTGCCALVPLNACENADPAHCLVNFSLGRQNERSSVRCRAAGDWFTREQVRLQTFCAAARGQEDAARASQLPWEQAGSSGVSAAGAPLLEDREKGVREAPSGKVRSGKR